jgi:hypothetical protein
MSARTWEDGLISPNRGAGGLTAHAMPFSFPAAGLTTLDSNAYTRLVVPPRLALAGNAGEWRNLGHGAVSPDSHPWPLGSGTPCRKDGSLSIRV